MSGCRGGDGPSAPPPPFQQTVVGNVVAYGANQHSLTRWRAGQLRLNLARANADIDLDLYLTDGTCGSYPPLNCTPLATTAAATSGTSETITRQVAAGDQIKFWVDNFSRKLASDHTVQVTIQ